MVNIDDDGWMLIMTDDIDDNGWMFKDVVWYR